MKYKRKRLPRMVTVPWIQVITGLALVVAGLIGNLIFDPSMIFYFCIYFSATMLIIILMFGRVRILKFILFCMRDSRVLSKYVGAWATRQVFFK